MEPFSALADPTRRRILELLADGDRSVGELVGHFEASQPAISRHLRLLREAGLVGRRSEGTRRLYRLEPEGLADVGTWVERRRRQWQRRLDALADHLDEGSQEEEEA